MVIVELIEILAERLEPYKCLVTRTSQMFADETSQMILVLKFNRNYLFTKVRDSPKNQSRKTAMSGSDNVSID
jgi:hypothetical protein